MKKTGQAFSAKWFGKACTVITTACLMAIFAFPGLPDAAVNGMLILCAVTMLLSLALYAKHFHASAEAVETQRRPLS